MDNEALLTPEAERKLSGQRRRDLVAAIILSVLSVLLFALYTLMIVEFILLRTMSGAGLGEGIGAAIVLIFSVIFGGACILISVISLIVCHVGRRNAKEGRGGIYRVLTAINAILPIIIIIAFVTVIILNNAGIIVPQE